MGEGPAQAAGMTERAGWRVIESPYDFKTLSWRLKAAIKDEKMGLVTRASASDGAKGQGIEIPGNEVIGVYRNDYARRMLSASVAAGIEAPIRFYLTEDTEGFAILSYKKPSFVFAPYMKEGGDELKGLAQELDMIFDDIADKAVDLDWQPQP